MPATTAAATPPAPPATVGDALGGDGTPLAVRWRGKEYPVHPPCPAVIDRVEKFVVRRAKDALDAVRDVLSPREWAEALDALLAKVGGNEHRAGGALWNAEMEADGGNRTLPVTLWACMAEAGADLSFEDVRDLFAEAPDEAHVAVAVVLPSFTEAACRRMKLPAAVTAAVVAGVAEQMAKAAAKRAAATADRTAGED